MSMLHRRSTKGFIVAVLLSATAVVVAPGSAEAAAPTLAVTPSTGLVDAQPVTVSGTGFAASSAVALTMCALGATSTDDCDYRQVPLVVSSEADGSFSAQFKVRRFVLPISGTETEPIDCASEACSVSAATPFAQAPQFVSVAVAFTDVVPPVPHDLLASPSTRLVDGRSVALTGTAFSPGESISLSQCPPDATGAADCVPAPKPVDVGLDGALTARFSVSRVQPDDGRLIDCLGVNCTIGVSSLSGFQQIPIAFTRPQLEVSSAPYATLKTGTNDVVAQATITCDVATPVSVSADITQPGIQGHYDLNGQRCSPSVPLVVFLPSRSLVQQDSDYALGPARIRMQLYPLRDHTATDPSSLPTWTDLDVQLIDADQVAAAIGTALLDPNNAELRAQLLRAINVRAAQDPVFRAELFAALHPPA